jgi:preprotein translocase subunit SecE
MADTDNPDAGMVAPPPRAARFSDEGKAARREHGQSPFGRMGQFIHDVRLEMRRVSWPTAKHVQNTTIITLIAVIFFAVYLFLIDHAFVQLVRGLDWLLTKIAGFLGLG